MKLELKDTPRTFRVGAVNQIEISDLGDIHLAPNEQLTFVSEAGPRYDIARKDWGYYATPSINGRLANEGFKTALVKNKQGLIYILLVEQANRTLFDNYCWQENQTLLAWLDEDFEIKVLSSDQGNKK
ncbi:MAG: hypothetical protein K9L88_02355 [Chromatiaceae bacterium]|nr:hypothetical protein [Chromatiaceae bacterium]